MNAVEGPALADSLSNRIPTLEPDDASPEVRSVYADFQRRMGFPAAPNFIKAQGHSLAVAQGTGDCVKRARRRRTAADDQRDAVRGNLPRSAVSIL